MRRTKPFDTAMLYLIAMAVLVGVQFALGGVVAEAGDAGYYLWTLALELLLGTVPVLIWTACRRQSIGESCNFRKPRFVSLVLAVCIAVCLYPVGMFINMAWMGFLMEMGATVPATVLPGLDRPGTWLLAVAAICVAPAVSEEMLFRGPMLSGCRRFGKWAAVLISAVLFSTLHFQLQSFWTLALIGGVAALLAWESGSIWPAMVLHFTNNFIAILLSGVSNALYENAEMAVTAAESAGAGMMLISMYTYLPMAVFFGGMFCLFYYLYLYANRGRALTPHQPRVVFLHGKDTAAWAVSVAVVLGAAAVMGITSIALFAAG